MLLGKVLTEREAERLKRAGGKAAVQSFEAVLLVAAASWVACDMAWQMDSQHRMNYCNRPLPDGSD